MKNVWQDDALTTLNEKQTELEGSKWNKVGTKRTVRLVDSEDYEELTNLGIRICHKAECNYCCTS